MPRKTAFSASRSEMNPTFSHAAVIDQRVTPILNTILRFASVLRQRLPGAPLAGPDVATATQWVKLFAGDEGKQIKLLTHHYYRAGQRQPAATFENLLHTDPRWIDILKQLRA